MSFTYSEKENHEDIMEAVHARIYLSNAPLQLNRIWNAREMLRYKDRGDKEVCKVSRLGRRTTVQCHAILADETRK